ncbi:torsin-1A-interacting protein 2-like isoform X2 [Cyclopterus lumpus]|uniref:torsin-1A-interacting protein 2-like isoform X2 n=1 Tax=Cyclopterus lumpus TaxID=8103 RepID=UPI0014866963|nr:torsin-1A-interacting protein 2-like isoform X2 [Cyclopterus lumpus]
MAEQEKDHHTADKGQEAQSTNMSHVSAFDECKQDETDIVNQQLSEDFALSSTNKETDDDNVVKPDVKNSNSAEEGMVPPIERSSPPEDDTTLNVKDNSNPDEGSHGDYEREMPRNEQKPMNAEISREYHPEEKKAPETTSPPTLDGKKDDQVDGPDEETPDSNAINTDAGEDDESCPEKEDEDIPTQTKGDVETIGPTIQETADAEITGLIGNCGGNLGIAYLTAASLLVLGIALLGQHLFQPKSPPQKDEVRQIDIFLRQLEKVKTQFPNQRTELWDRSKIHLLRHLQTTQPTEPVSLILTAGHRGEKTLHCLAQRLASAFSSALNASVLHIDGASKASQDSDQVKLDIDSKLQGAFEGDKPVAVINRFEELPPGSTLIFYRYCDHENAAYKKTCLIFTVLLGEEEEIPSETRLSAVEELVDDHLQKKFLSHGHPVSFDRMDLDKYSGLWSRISHLILPVAAEERIEREGC